MIREKFANLLDPILGSRFWALFQKESAQLLNNRQLLAQLLLPPTVFLIVFGAALSPDIQNIKVGITDYSNSNASREFLEIFDQTNTFVIRGYYSDQQDMTADLETGVLTVGITIQPDFADDIARKRTTEVQALFDAVDANTVNIASSYASQLVSDYNSRQRNSTAAEVNQVQVQTSALYNPGLETSWFILSGLFGIVLTAVGSLASSSSVVREKEAGTIEQLVMTPASSTEIFLAKLCPLLILLTVDILLAVGLARLVFQLPFRGNLLLFLFIAVIYFWVGISIGILIGTYSKSQQQTQLTAFFVNPPLILLCGALTPISSMPTAVQWVSHLDPLRYFSEVSRGILLKGVGIEALWPQVLILLIFATVLMTLSIRQFGRQLG